MTVAVEGPVYVFGIVRSGAKLPDPGNHELAARLRLVEADELAAVVGSVPGDRPLGRASDLMAHDQILSDLVARGVPVLPMRFGAVLTDEEAVAEELLHENYDRFVTALRSVSGHAQYTVRVRYEEDVAVKEAVEADPRIARLRSDGPQPYEQQIRLGEYVVRAIEARRTTDADAVLQALDGFGELRRRELGDPLDVLDAAVLVAFDRVPQFRERIEQLTGQHSGRLQFRLIGPSPAYDFVGDN